MENSLSTMSLDTLVNKLIDLSVSFGSKLLVALLVFFIGRWIVKKLKLTTISELIKNIYCSLSVIIIGCASAYAVEFNKDLIEAEDRENVNLSQFETDGQLPVGKYSLFCF